MFKVCHNVANELVKQSKGRNTDATGEIPPNIELI